MFNKMSIIEKKLNTEEEKTRELCHVNQLKPNFHHMNQLNWLRPQTFNSLYNNFLSYYLVIPLTNKTKFTKIQQISKIKGGYFSQFTIIIRFILLRNSFCWWAQRSFCWSHTM